MFIANPLQIPTNIYLYTLHPTRPAMLTEGATDSERALAAQHWVYSQDLLKKEVVIFAGRTLVKTEDSFATVVIRANSEEEALAIMNEDPAVKKGLFRARLFPYQPMLMGPCLEEV
jgi:uncharacterized protein YciI